MNREQWMMVPLAVALGVFVVGLDIAICPVAGIFGVPCPSCGLTRATVMLVQGDFERAVAIHPGVLPVSVYLAAATWFCSRGHSHEARVRIAAVSGVVLLLGLTLLWIARFIGYWGGPVPVHPWRL